MSGNLGHSLFLTTRPLLLVAIKVNRQRYRSVSSSGVTVVGDATALPRWESFVTNVVLSLKPYHAHGVGSEMNSVTKRAAIAGLPLLLKAS